MDIGLKIRQLRREKNLSARDLAESLGVTKELIYAYEKRRVIPPLDKLEVIADFFGKNLNYFINENTKQTENTKQAEGNTINLREQLLTLKGVLIGKGYWQEIEPYFPKYKASDLVPAMF